MCTEPRKQKRFAASKHLMSTYLEWALELNLCFRCKTSGGKHAHQFLEAARVTIKQSFVHFAYTLKMPSNKHDRNQMNLQCNEEKYKHMKQCEGKKCSRIEFHYCIARKGNKQPIVSTFVELPFYDSNIYVLINFQANVVCYCHTCSTFIYILYTLHIPVIMQIFG